jgi:hypothetical protein
VHLPRRIGQEGLSPYLRLSLLAVIAFVCANHKLHRLMEIIHHQLWLSSRFAQYFVDYFLRVRHVWPAPVTFR